MHVKESTAPLVGVAVPTEATIPALSRGEGCSDRRERGALHQPESPRIAPTGHPPTLSRPVKKFSGSLEELIDICASAEAGSVVDLGGESVQGSTDDLSGVSFSSIASVDDGASDTASTGTSHPESSPGTGAAAAVATPAPRRQRGVEADLAMLMQQSPPFLLAEAPPVETGTLEPTYSFASIGKAVDKEALSGSIWSTACFDDPLLDAPRTDPVAAPAGSGMGASRLLRKIASEAGMRMRNSVENAPAGSLSTSECVRRSCEFDSKGLDDRLAPDTCAPPVSCIVLPASNITIKNGSIVLPPGHLLLLEGCSVTFENCHISGTGVRCSSSKSLPLVYILQSEVVMHDCRVCRSDGHGVGVGKSSSLVMQRCHVSDHQTCGLVVRGATSSVDLEDCSLESNGQDGIAVSDGALARASNCMLSRNGMLGLGVSAAAKAFLVSCNIERNGTHGLAAHAASSLNATSCSISGCEAAILALDPATVVHSTACNLFKNEQGIHAREGAQVIAVDTSIERHTIGALVTSNRSFLDLSESSVKHCRRAGVHVLGGARAKLHSCSISSNAENGCFTKHAHSTVLATEVCFTGNGTSGAQVSVGASMHLHECELSDNRVAGAQSTDADTCMVLRGCSVVKNGTIGLFANKGSSVSATSCKLQQNGSSGCEVRDRCTRVLATACELSENGRVGVYVHSAGTMNLVACTVVKNRSLALLCGGREGTDIGGGLVTHCPQTELDGGSKMRHGGRVYKSSEGEEQEPVDVVVAVE